MTWVDIGQIANRVVFTLETRINRKRNKMRLHKFHHNHGEIWIDLDQVAMVRDHGRGRTGLLVSGFTQEVNEEVQDVLALLQGPPPPDRYEESLAGFGTAASRPADGLEDRPMTAEDGLDDTKIRAARLDEIKRLEEDITERMGFVPERLRTAFDWRRESIRKYGV